MSTPSEYPGSEQSGTQPPAGDPGTRPATDPASEPSRQQVPPGYASPAGNQQPGYQQPGYQQPPAYQQPGYQQPPAYQAPPAYQHTAGGFQNEYQQRPKSPAANFSNFPQRLRDLSSIPREVKNAYLLFVAGALLNVLASLIGIFVAASRGGIFVAAGIVGLVFSVSFAAVFIWLALLTKEGVGWARIVMLVLAALSILGALTSLLGMFASVLAFINVLAYVASVIAGIMLLLPPAQAYFAARRPQGRLR
ncbi:hypothetical protein [Arthrobacter sp. H14-L1]|uniref:hypothetical protein n=1 Tax=Arthrobacter sp. H14-L1 TaxID=2996697 RepID=UPI00226F5E07|nr:hypothetical protein [Arthrobacter sp. H14-L1]MCY0903994.1 hypothetical protein [Arthrobacter sp. H14-L1]